MTMPSAKVEVRAVSKSYGSSASGRFVNALLPVDLVVQHGEFICIVGPSGCGKSTILNCIAGLVVPTAGQVLVDGVPVVGPGRDRGMVFQEHGLFPWMTVGENVGFGPRLRGIEKPERASIVEKYLALVGLGGWEQRFPGELSGGMKQRVGIARALANAPEILLLDEPFGSLDALTRDLMQDELLNIWQTEKVTCIFVTHSIAEAVFLADRIVVMSARPGHIKTVLKVTAARRRDRTSPEFSEIYRTAEQLLAPEPRQ
jgi:NitT/TauT family transport system ATP-binding protein